MLKPIVAVLLVLTGIGLLGASVYNVHVGLGEDGDGAPFKVKWKPMLDGSCDSDDIAPCAGTIGLYEASDIVLLVAGLVILIVARVVGSGQQRKGKHAVRMRRRRRLAKLELGASLLLFISAGADIAGVLSADGAPLDWSELVGIEVPANIIQVATVIFAVALLFHSKKTLKSLGKSNRDDGSSSRFGGKSKFKGSLEARGGKGIVTVGDLRRAMSLDMYEDAFQVGTSDDFGDSSVGNTCHYCNGAGCENCGGTGSRS